MEAGTEDRSLRPFLAGKRDDASGRQLLERIDALQMSHLVRVDENKRCRCQEEEANRDRGNAAKQP